MNIVTLVLQERFSYRVDIDISTFGFRGHTTHYDYDDNKSYCFISFRLAEPEKSSQVVEELRDAFKYNVNKEEWIALKTDFEDYQEDKRPIISIKLPNGSRGIADPSTFSFE